MSNVIQFPTRPQFEPLPEFPETPEPEKGYEYLTLYLTHDEAAAVEAFICQRAKELRAH